MAYITKEQTAKARKIANEIGKKYGFKLSTTMENHSTLHIALISGRAITLEDIKLSNSMKQFIAVHGIKDLTERHFVTLAHDVLTADTAYYYDMAREYRNICELLNDGRTQWISILSDNSDIVKMFKEIERAVKKALKWYDNTETMIDYFDTAFYFETSIGKWNKPYKAEEVAKAKAESHDFKEILFDAEIEDFTHTRTKEVLTVAKPKNRLSKEVFKDFCAWIKKEGIGYYSRYAKGFILA